MDDRNLKAHYSDILDQHSRRAVVEGALILNKLKSHECEFEWAHLQMVEEDAKQKVQEQENEDERSCDDATLEQNDHDKNRESLKSLVNNIDDISAADLLALIKPPRITDTMSQLHSCSLSSPEIVHINYLVSLFTDSICSIKISDNLASKKGISPVDIMDIHLCTCLRILYFIYKNEEFQKLLLKDQLYLLEKGLIRCSVACFVFMYNPETRSLQIPTGEQHTPPFVLHSSDLVQILPPDLVMRLYAILEVGCKLIYNWPLGVLAMLAFFYCPADEPQIVERESISILRSWYVKIMLKYFQWRHGESCANLVFLEVLKLMDVILKHCHDVESVPLHYTDSEVAAINERLNVTKSFLEPSLRCITYSELHKRLVFAVTCSSYNVKFSAAASLSDHSLAPNHGIVKDYASSFVGAHFSAIDSNLEIFRSLLAKLTGYAHAFGCINIVNNNINNAQVKFLKEKPGLDNQNYC